MDSKIEIKELPDLNLASITGVHKGFGKTFEKLIAWANEEGLEIGKSKMITIYHDSFKTTEADKVRMSACIILDKKIEPTNEIELTSIKKGKYIVGRFEVNSQELGKSWGELFGWMIRNRYKKSSKNPYEIYHNDISKHPEKKWILDLCIPIE